jgi:8-oxo-dGTP pyrophosphatase MutT (NUDIX family)
MLSCVRERVGGLEVPAAEEADAAVLIGLTRSHDPGVILTLRAAHMSTHPGEVAFPGGRREPWDADLVATALRESQEEIALDPAGVEIIGALPGRISRFGVRVCPVVAIVPADLQLVPNRAELDEVYRIPLTHFLQRDNLRIDRVLHQGREKDVPWFPWGERRVWGLTALMLIDLLQAVFDYRLELRR